MKRLLACLGTALVLAGCSSSGSDALAPKTVDNVDLKRYQGTWYEQARLPMFFQRNCAANITATYTPREDGRIGVRNACDDKQGKRMVSEGVARPVPGQPGQLEVRFAPDWLAWVPMVWADYWVIDLDPDYQWAVVGGPSRKYLWILSRTPTMARSKYDAIVARAAQRGYPVDELVLPLGTLD